jgi:hypothetical protein
MVLGHFRKRRPRLAIPILETFPVRDGLRDLRHGTYEEDRVNDIRFQLNESEVKAHINKAAAYKSLQREN